MRLQGVRSCSAHLKKPDRLAKLWYLATRPKKWKARSLDLPRAHVRRDDWPPFASCCALLRRSWSGVPPLPLCGEVGALELTSATWAFMRPNALLRFALM